MSESKIQKSTFSTSVRNKEIISNGLLLQVDIHCFFSVFDVPEVLRTS